MQPAADEDDEPVPDLMAALKASLDAVRDKEADASNGAGKAKKAPAKAKAKPAASRKKAPSKS